MKNNFIDNTAKFSPCEAAAHQIWATDSGSGAGPCEHVGFLSD